MARVKKISKSIEGSILTITAGGEVMKFDSTLLSDRVKSHLVMHGLSQKLGDSAAGAKDGVEAVGYIKATWDTLTNGEWSSRKPAGEKVSKRGIIEKFANLSEKERAIAEPLLKKLGII